MIFTPEDFKYIEKYLTGKLSEEEQQAFEDQMETDSVFFRKVQHQMSIYDFFEHRYMELVMQDELEGLIANAIEKKTDFERIKNLVAEYAKLVAALFIGLGIGWFIFRNVPSEPSQLLTEKTIKRSIFLEPENSFGDQPDSVVTNIVLQILSDNKRVLNAFTYSDDTLKLYNVPSEILNSQSLSLFYRNPTYYFKADTLQYRLNEKEIGVGTFELYKPKIQQK